MKIPSDYNEGYPKARETDPEMADNYLAHTHIGDPVAEAMTDDLIDLGESKSWRLIQASMDDPGGEALRDAPASVREFFNDAETPPEWLDYASFAPAVRMFHRNSGVVLAAFVAGVLVEGFTTNIAKDGLNKSGGGGSGSAYARGQPAPGEDTRCSHSDHSPMWSTTGRSARRDGRSCCGAWTA